MRYFMEDSSGKFLIDNEQFAEFEKKKKCQHNVTILTSHNSP